MYWLIWNQWRQRESDRPCGASLAAFSFVLLVHCTDSIKTLILGNVITIAGANVTFNKERDTPHSADCWRGLVNVIRVQTHFFLFWPSFFVCSTSLQSLSYGCGIFLAPGCSYWLSSCWRHDVCLCARALLLSYTASYFVWKASLEKTRRMNPLTGASTV